MRVILSHPGSPDRLAFMYSPIVLTLTEGFARGGALVLSGSTGWQNGTRDRWTRQTLSEELCAAPIDGQSQAYRSSTRATTPLAPIHPWCAAYAQLAHGVAARTQGAAAARRRLRVAGALAVSGQADDEGTRGAKTQRRGLRTLHD